MSDFAVIIVTYNAKPYIRACLDSLRNQEADNYRVYVVDNASKDETCQIIERYYPEVTLVKNKVNLGFSKANNVGIGKGISDEAKYFVLLNQDTVVEDNFILAGKMILQKNNIGLASPRILYKENNKIWWVGSKVYRGKDLYYRASFTVAEHLHKKGDLQGRFNKVSESGYLPGTALFFKKEIVEKVGLLSESFFMYGEDLDFSLRVKEKGYRLVYFPETTVYHDTPYFSREKKSLSQIYKKYKNYLTGVRKVVYKHFTFSEQIVWTVKLPFTLFLTCIRELLP